MEDPVEGGDPLLAEGTRLGDFQIRGLLGEGSMAQVYLAHDITLGRRVALKLIKRSAMQRDGVARFLEEARATAAFNHPHIVTLHAVGEHDGRPYLALEYIDGESLRARLRAGPLPMRDALRCGHAVADAIAEAHRRGLVHADLKPENIVISSDGRVRVVDFGLAKLAGATPNAMSGTPAYMAPERWRGVPPTGAIDVWALGITLHELITGDRPIGDYELPHLSFATDALELPALPAAPWAQLVRDCLAFDPEARPTAEEALHRLAALLDPRPAAAVEEARATGGAAASAPRLALGLQETSAGPLRLAFSAHNAGPPGDAWLVPVVERMMRGTFRDRQDRRFHVVEHGGDGTRIELAVVRASELIRIDALDAAEGRLVASASAGSVAGAVHVLAGRLAAELGAGREPAGPDAAELEAMHRIGATSVELYRRYRRVLHTLHATNHPDLRDLAAAARGIIADDPAWAHPYALLAVIEGQTTDAAREVLAAARTAASAARDPSGMQLMATLDPDVRSEPEAAFHVVEEVFQENDDDLLAGLVLGMWALMVHRTEEVVAITQHLHARFPDLLFGMELAEWLRRETRDTDADRVIRDWVAAAPDNLMARVELVRIEANAGRLGEARARAREVLAIHGDRDDALPDLFEALVASDQISDAREIADRMLTGSPLARARGRYRVAMTAVFEGRFAAAYNAVRRAITEHRAFGIQSELTQCLELARSIAPLVADVAAQRRYTEELAAAFATMVGDAGAAAATRFELALLEGRKAAPSIDDHLAGLEDGPVRDVARRRMLRAAAVAGRGSPHVAVAAGFSAFEENTASLVALGLCAWRVHELGLARRSLELATLRWSSAHNNNQNSPYHAVLARFHLAGVLAELGELAAARAAYEAFLRCWSSPDRPIPEVALARKALEAKPIAGR